METRDYAVFLVQLPPQDDPQESGTGRNDEYLLLCEGDLSAYEAPALRVSTAEIRGSLTGTRVRVHP